MLCTAELTQSTVPMGMHMLILLQVEPCHLSGKSNGIFICNKTTLIHGHNDESIQYDNQSIQHFAVLCIGVI